MFDKKEYHQRPEVKERLENHSRNVELKKQVIQIFGGKCNCKDCEITEWWVLIVVHIKPIIDENPNTIKFYKSIVAGNTDNLQLLCYGCNSSKRMSGKCRLDHSDSWEINHQ